MNPAPAKLSVLEKLGYSAGDSAANFVFMTMVLFQLNFYTDVFGLSASAAAAIILWPRLWDAIFDPIMGILADRTNTRWGKFRPWVLWTAIPWAACMVLAYTTPKGWSLGMLIAYAGITNTILMTLYSMNNMPYSALGGVMTADLNERTSLNSYRFVSANIAQFIVGGCTLPLVAKFAVGHDLQHGWQLTMALWATVCLVCFFITFFSTRERIKPVVETVSSPKDDLRDLCRNAPWWALLAYTVCNFAMLTYRGGAFFNFYHHYADKGAMFDFLHRLHLTTPDMASHGGALEFLGYIVHGTRETATNTADVFNSILNMAETGTTIVVIILTTGLSARFGRKAVIVTGFSLCAVTTACYYFVSPTNTAAMLAIRMLVSLFYAPTIAPAWAMYADAADYSEWQTGRRFTGMVYATIGFALKSGLAFGSAVFLWLMVGFWNYDTKLPSAPNAVAGYHFSLSIVVALIFAGGAAAIGCSKLNKATTLRMAAELEERRRLKAAGAASSVAPA